MDEIEKCLTQIFDENKNRIVDSIISSVLDDLITLVLEESSFSEYDKVNSIKESVKSRLMKGRNGN